MADDNGRSFHGPPGLGLGAYKSMRAPARAFSAPPSVDDIDSLFSELNHAMDKSSRLVCSTLALLLSQPTQLDNLRNWLGRHTTKQS
eukprot:2294675-Pleurochrysis_carterae.AAC.2